ncbi:MAG: glycerophosphodiester phosphodiesterase [Lentimicrobium sp.]
MKTFLIIITILVTIFLVIVFSFGGFGRKAGISVFSAGADSTILFAHRGVVGKFPENSLESIGEAKRLGFRAVEFDLRKSAGGDFILFHDVDCKRMLGTEFEIQDVPTSDLKTFPIVQNGKVTSFFVPTLKEVLDRHHTDFIFYFDMKLTGFAEADQVVEIIRKYQIEKSVIVASADYLFNLYLELKYPEIITALEGLNSGKEWTYSIIPKNLKPDYLSGFLNKVDENHMQWLRKRELVQKRIVYGVDSSNFPAARNMGLKNFILDYDAENPVFNDPGIIPDRTDNK